MFGPQVRFYPIHLRCEYLENPLGLDSPQPHLSWKLYGKRPGLRQIAYRIQYSNQPNNFNPTVLIWDTGRVESSVSIQIKYAGGNLLSRELIYWRVQIWNELGEASEWSKIVFWEM